MQPIVLLTPMPPETPPRLNFYRVAFQIAHTKLEFNYFNGEADEMDTGLDLMNNRLVLLRNLMG